VKANVKRHGVYVHLTLHTVVLIEIQRLCHTFGFASNKRRSVEVHMHSTPQYVSLCLLRALLCNISFQQHLCTAGNRGCISTSSCTNTSVPFGNGVVGVHCTPCSTPLHRREPGVHLHFFDAHPSVFVHLTHSVGVWAFFASPLHPKGVGLLRRCIPKGAAANELIPPYVSLFFGSIVQVKGGTPHLSLVNRRTVMH